jgi:hypothetical protein
MFLNQMRFLIFPSAQMRPQIHAHLCGIEEAEGYSLSHQIEKQGEIMDIGEPAIDW